MLAPPNLECGHSDSSSDEIPSEENESDMQLRNISTEMRKRWLELKATSQDGMRFCGDELHVLKMFFLALDRDCDGVISAKDFGDFASETSNNIVGPLDMTLLMACTSEKAQITPSTPKCSTSEVKDEDRATGCGTAWGWLDPDAEEFRPYPHYDCETLEQALKESKEKVVLNAEREDDEVDVIVQLQGTPPANYMEVCHRLKTKREVQRVLGPKIPLAGDLPLGLDFASFLRFAVRLKQRRVLEQARSHMVEAAATYSIPT